MDKRDVALPEFMMAATLAEKAGVSGSYVSRLCRNGTIPAQKIGQIWLIRHEDAVAWLEDRDSRQKSDPEA